MSTLLKEDEAALYADENWMDYFDSCIGDFKHAWCEAHSAFMNDELEEGDK